MARTYRKYPVYYYYANGIEYTSDQHSDIVDFEIKEFYKSKKNYWLFYRSVPSGSWYGFEKYNLKNRDHKPWGKPIKWFKQMKRRKERAQIKNAIRNNKEVPLFKHSDQWDWT